MNVVITDGTITDSDIISNSNNVVAVSMTDTTPLTTQATAVVCEEYQTGHDDATSVSSSDVSAGEINLSNLLASHTTPQHLDELAKSNVPLQFIIYSSDEVMSEEQVVTSNGDANDIQVIAVEDDAETEVSLVDVDDAADGEGGAKVDQPVVSTYHVQTLNAAGTLVPSVIHNIPMGAFLNGNTSVQIVNSVKSTPRHAEVQRPVQGNAKVSGKSNLNVPMSWTLTPIASKATLATDSNVDEITANVQQGKRASSVSRQQVMNDGQQQLKADVKPLIAIKQKPEVQGNVLKVAGGMRNSVSQTRTVTQASPRKIVAAGVDVPTTTSSIPVVLKGSILNEAVLYPIDVKNVMFGQSQKPALISANLLSMIQTDQQKTELQDAVKSIGTEQIEGETSTYEVHTEDYANTLEHGSIQPMTDKAISTSSLQKQDESTVTKILMDLQATNAKVVRQRPIEPKATLRKLKSRIKSLDRPRSNAPGGSRMRLRPWLEHLLATEEIEGLNWVDYGERIFRIPWKHASEGSWQADDSIVFRQYAIHSGKYPSDGPTTPQLHTKWKANFRCALNSLSDIVLLREISNPRGQKAYRIYKFLDHKPKNIQLKREESATTNRAKQGGDDLSTLSSQDAGELLIALKRGARDFSLHGDTNISSSQGDSDTDAGQHVVPVFPQFHKISNEYGETQELIEVGKEVVIPVEGSVIEEADESVEKRNKMSVKDKDIRDLLRQAMAASRSSDAAKKDSTSDMDDQATDEVERGDANGDDTALDIIKAEIYFMNTLPEALSPLALKLAATTFEDVPCDDDVMELPWLPKSEFMFRFEGSDGVELWTALLWCVMCGQCFTSLARLRQHVSLHQEKHLWIDEQLTPAGSQLDASSSDCLVCGLRFAKTTTMIRHLLQHSISFSFGCASDNKQYDKCPACVVCRKYFVNVCKLSIHMQSHICPICHMTTIDVEKHITKSHTTGGLYQCYICMLYLPSQQHMLFHQIVAHSGIYSIDTIYRVKQTWFAYCKQCYHLVRVHYGNQAVCEECTRHHCSGCDSMYKGYIYFLMHALKNESKQECVDCAYDRITASHHLSSFYRRRIPNDSQDSSTLHQFADVALGEHVIESSTPAEKDTDSGSDTSARTSGKATQNSKKDTRLTAKCVAESIVEGHDAEDKSWFTGGEQLSRESTTVSPSVQYGNGDVVYIEPNVASEEVAVETATEVVVAEETESPRKRRNTREAVTSSGSKKAKQGFMTMTRRSLADKLSKMHECSVCQELFESVKLLRRHKMENHK